LLNTFNSDVNIFILRNPLSNFSGWKSSKWGNYYDDVRNFTASYLKLLDIIVASRKHKPTLVIRYEELTKNGVDYLSEVCKNVLEIPKNLTLVKSSPGLGDERAKESTEIESARMTYDNLNQNEIETCKKLLIPYKQI